MSRQFKKSQYMPSDSSWYYGAKWKTEAYTVNPIPKAIKDVGFVERIHYGVMDNNNYSIVPKEDRMVYLPGGDPLSSPRVFDFVADAWSVMRLNFTVACQKDLIQKQGAAFAELEVVQAYENPRLKYIKYLNNILDFYNKRYIIEIVGLNNITSYDDYVNHFFKMNERNGLGKPITLSGWLKSYGSSILDTGLAIKYFDIPPNDDQRKINEIIDHPSFDYFKNLCLNMGFSILKDTPNILLFDISSPAARPYLLRKNLLRLDTVFERNYDRSYIYDMDILYNNINLYYNRLVAIAPASQTVQVGCGKLVSSWTYRDNIDQLYRPDGDTMLRHCLILRNMEEGKPFTQQKLDAMYKKAKYFQNSFDTMRAMGYISSIFKEQVWNKDYGYSDLVRKLQNRTTNVDDGVVRGEAATPSMGPSSGMGGGTSGGSGGSSGY
jgi:hypothetical protein